jgi:hypothetical protein
LHGSGQHERGIDGACITRDASAMAKRIFAGVVWFLVVGYLWNLLALVVDFPDWPGLVLGAVAAYLFARDPLARIWTRQAPAAQVGGAEAQPA